MTDEERELDLQLGDMRRENNILRHRLERAVTEALRLRHKLEHVYALSQLALSENVTEREGSAEAITHADTASY
jgi:hypothetical protein